MSKQKHIREVANLIKGSCFKLYLNKKYSVIYKLCWVFGQEYCIESFLVVFNDTDKFHDQLLRSLQTYEIDDYMESKYDYIMKKIRNTQDSFRFQKRIKSECKWADQYDGCWESEILDPAEELSNES
jgi:hypothetical protein